jgi:hypothetical protein
LKALIARADANAKVIWPTSSPRTTGSRQSRRQGSDALQHLRVPEASSIPAITGLDDADAQAAFAKGFVSVC